MDVSQITALIGAAASLLCTVVVGALTFFMKKTLTSLEEADKRNAEDIKTLELSLYRRWNREVPKGYASNWLDMQQVLARARTHGVAWKADRVRKWRQRKHVRARRFGEQWCYWWPDLQQRISS